MVKWKDVKKAKREAARKEKRMRPDPAPKTKTITTAQWTEAIKILMKKSETSTELSASDIKKLKEKRGEGLGQDEAVKTIDAMGWRMK